MGGSSYLTVRDLELSFDVEQASGRRRLCGASRLPLGIAGLLMAVLLVGVAVLGWRAPSRLTSSQQSLERETGALFASSIRAQKVSSGTCASNGMQAIHDEAQCTASAQALGLSSTVVLHTSIDNRPEGCYYFVNATDNTQTLWLDPNSANKGKGVETSNFANGWLREPICSCSSRPVSARAFEMPQVDSQACTLEGAQIRGYKFNAAPRPGGGPEVSHWHGQNLCWAWMKEIGCYAKNWGNVSWRTGQALAAQAGYAPDPMVFPMQALRQPQVCEDETFGAPLVDIRPGEAKDAKAWFTQHVSVYVLNLPRDTQRLASISSRLAQLGIDFQIVAGVDLSVPGAIATAQQDGLIPQTFNLTSAKTNGDTTFQDMHGIAGTVGCAAAHLKAMQAALTHRAAHPLALILEDDVELVDDFIVKLRRLLDKEAPCDWEAISLKSKCPYGECVSEHLSRVWPDGNEPAERCRHGVNYGFFAMLYRLRDLKDLRTKLSAVVWDEKRPHCLDIDVALASISDKVGYYAVPNVQVPGFLTEGNHGSSRVDLNTIQMLPQSSS